MQFSRAVLTTLAPDASSAAVRCQFSFKIWYNNASEEHSSIHSILEPTASVAQVKKLQSRKQVILSWVGSAVPTTTPLPIKSPRNLSYRQQPGSLHTILKAAGASNVFNGSKSEVTSYSTVVESTSTAGHVCSDFSEGGRNRIQLVSF
jgi:hypothetical protein